MSKKIKKLRNKYREDNINNFQNLKKDSSKLLSLNTWAKNKPLILLTTGAVAGYLITSGTGKNIIKKHKNTASSKLNIAVSAILSKVVGSIIEEFKESHYNENKQQETIH